MRGGQRRTCEYQSLWAAARITEEKNAYIYDPKTIAIEFVGIAGTSIALEGHDMAIKKLTAKP